MTRRIANVSMMILAVAYTITSVVIVCTGSCECLNVVSLISIGFGIVGGSWLAFSIGRHLMKSTKKTSQTRGYYKIQKKLRKP